MHFDKDGLLAPRFVSKFAILLGLSLLLMLTALPVQAQQMLYAPVSGTVTSNFGWRNDPMGAGSRFHSGLDIAASQGTPINAPQNAYVAYSGLYKGYGNVVVLDHGYGLYTLYGHASALYVKAGQAVSRGQTIAAVGTTGRSTGPHLHFEVHQNGQYVNPMVYLNYLAQGVPAETIQLSQAHPTSVATKPVQPIQVTLAQESQQVKPEVATADSIPPQLMVAQESPETEMGKASQGVSVPVKLPPAKVASSKAKKPNSRHVASKAGKRVGRYLASSAVQVVSGKRVSWVRF